MTTLASDFESDLRDSLLDEAEHEMVGKFDSFVARFVEVVHANLRAYASRHGYDVESTIDSIQQPEVDTSGNSVTIRVGWAHEQMARWEFGTSDHRVEGDPLSFIWHDPPQWVREQFEQERTSGGQFAPGWRVFLNETHPSGIPESRAVRDGMNALRRVMQA